MVRKERETNETTDRSDYFLALPEDFIFHGKRDKKED